MTGDLKRQAEVAERAGRTAFWRGKKYEDNPFTFLRPVGRLAWSNGFTYARIQKIFMQEEGLLP